MQTQEAPRQMESVTAAGNQVIDTVKNLIHEGNVRRISIKQDGTRSVDDVIRRTGDRFTLPVACVDRLPDSGVPGSDGWW
jgi:hypothetical protein